MRQKEDYLFKGILEEIFDDFLKFLQANAEDIFDFSKGIVFLDKELRQLFPPENDEYSPKVVDKLAKVFTRDGKEEWILIHVEVQAVYRKDFARRMYNYFARILDKYDKPIAAYAILTEGNTIARPDTFKLEFLGTSLIYRFNTYKIAEQNDQELLAGNNPFALVVLTVKAALAGKEIKDSQQRDELLLELKLKLVHEMLNKQIPKEKIRILMNFLRYYVRFENTEANVTFDREIEKLTGRSNTMGIEELLLEKARHDGLQKGLQKGKIQTIRNLIIKHGWTDEQIADVAEVSIDFVKKVRASLKKQK
jgi:predicted transposase/invertase (TIGR01784 family)